MKHSIAGVAPDLLAPVYLNRFMALFNVAARKSLIQWTRANTGDAQLALLDASSQGEAVPASTPCVIYVGQTSPVTEKARNARWVSHLPAEFTVSDLIDALDRAAVFLMDWSARQKVSAARAVAAATTGVAAVAPVIQTQEQLQEQTLAQAVAADEQFQLTSWVAMEAPFNTGACVRAMALLTRSPIDLRQLSSHSGLDMDTAKELIASLNRRGVLRMTAHNAHVVAAPVQAQDAAAHRARAVRPGLIQRLTRWVRVGGRV